MLFRNFSQQYFPAADDLVRYLEAYTAYFELDVRYGINVVRISKDLKFRVQDSHGNIYSCLRLIIATGLSKTYVPQIPGIYLAETYGSVSITREEFANQSVLIIGKGNAAFETADHLVETAASIHLVSPHPLRMALDTRYAGDVRAINSNIVDSYQLSLQNAVLDAIVEKVDRQDGKYLVSMRRIGPSSRQESLTYDRVIVCTGFRFDNSIFESSCKPDLTNDNRLPAQTSEWESTNIRDLYFAGTLMQARDYKRAPSAFIHGFRYNICALHHILETKYYGSEWPSQAIPVTPEGMADVIITRVNSNSAIWLQRGMLCDVILVSERARVAQYYRELPIDYLLDTHFGGSNHYFTITIEYSDETVYAGSNLVQLRSTQNVDRESLPPSRHLVHLIRHFSSAKLVSEHRIDTEGWPQEVNRKRLIEIFSLELREL
jgi:thioredoxin reductase